MCSALANLGKYGLCTRVRFGIREMNDVRHVSCVYESVCWRRSGIDDAEVRHTESARAVSENCEEIYAWFDQQCGCFNRCQTGFFHPRACLAWTCLCVLRVRANFPSCALARSLFHTHTHVVWRTLLYTTTIASLAHVHVGACEWVVGQQRARTRQRRAYIFLATQRRSCVRVRAHHLYTHCRYWSGKIRNGTSVFMRGGGFVSFSRLHRFQCRDVRPRRVYVMMGCVRDCVQAHTRICWCSWGGIRPFYSTTNCIKYYSVVGQWHS